MTLSVAEIERWDAGDVREVFHAASDRAQAARDAANGIATLPALATWGGVAAAAAKAAIGKTRRDLDAHGREALVVANAARSAADEIERIKSELAPLRGDAAELGLVIDAVSGRVAADPGFNGTAAELRNHQQQLQPRLDKLVVQANLVDLSLANAIKMADGTTPIPNAPLASLPVAAPTLPAGNPAEAAPKTWKDLVLPPDATDPAGVGTATLPDSLFPPGVSADPAATPKTLDEALFPPGGPQPAAAPSLLDRLNPQRPVAAGDPRYTRSPLSAPIVGAEPSAIEQQLARVNNARANLDAAQSRLNAAAANGYTAGAGGGPGRGATDALSQSVFDARRELTQQTAILDDINAARTEVGGRPVGVPALPENTGVQSFPPSPSFASQAAAGLTESSHDINRETFGLVPDVAKDIDVFRHWGQHSGPDRAGALIDVASSVPIPGAKFLGPVVHGMSDLLGIGDHVPSGVVDHLASGGAHAHPDHVPASAGDHPVTHADSDAGHVAHYSVEDTAALLAASEASGGHLLEKHVGKSLEYLQGRLDARPGLDAVSTFRSFDEATAAVSTAFQHNQQKLDNWIANGASEKLKLEAPFTGGTVLRRGAGDVVTGTDVRFVLKGNGKGGWYVFTGYLEP